MEKTFNMGVGMIAVVAPEDTDRALAILTARHLDCWVLGTVCKGGKEGPRAKLVGHTRDSGRGLTVSDAVLMPTASAWPPGS